LRIGKLARSKQVLGAIVAAVLLTVIFVPFQQANAFTVTTTLPNASGGAINNSVSGENFQITIAVAAGELISIQSITLILDNGLSSVKTATFNSAGNFASGDNTLVIDNTVAISAFAATSGYGYGFGSVSNGITGFSGYSYSFSSTNNYISGNSGGANNPATLPVTGLLGPGSITITGKIRTANLAAATHTLDVLINTGAGGSNNNLAAPQLSFTVNANSNVVSVTVSVPASTPVNITIPSTGAQVSISFGGGATGSVAVEKKTLSAINTQIPAAFTSVGSSTATFTVAGSAATTVGDVFEFDLSAASVSGSVTVTLPYNPSLVPSGQSPTLFRWTGTAWEQATNVSVTSNTITGTFSGLSPVVAGAFTPAPAPSGGGGGGGGRGPVILLPPVTEPTVTIYPPSYFETNPLAKFQVSSSALLNMGGVSINQTSVGQQLSIAGTFSNHQQVSQEYAFIVQVIDENNVVTAISWQTGTLASGGTTDVSTSWTPEAGGNYTVKIFVWDGISTPMPLSQVTEKTIAVT